MFRFLHIADAHLETAFGGGPAARERLRRATLEAFTRAIDLCAERELHALLIAGDLFDDPLLSPRVELFLARELRRALDAGVSIALCAGNHDPGSRNRRLATIGLAELARVSREGNARLHLFLEREPRAVRVLDRDGEPVGIVVGAGHPTERESENLVATFPRIDESLPIVGLVHTQVESARSAQLHDRYAPSTPRDLARAGYDYWALGHVHLRGRVAPDVPAWYAGNLQGRNARECGPKGGLVVELCAGEPAAPRFVALAPVRWERLRVELDGETNLEALSDRVATETRALAASIEEELALRVELVGESALARALRDEEGRHELERELAARTELLELQLRTADVRPRLDRRRLRGAPSILAKALETLRTAREDPARLAALAPDELPGLARVLRDGADEAARDAYLADLLDALDAELFEHALDLELVAEFAAAGDAAREGEADEDAHSREVEASREPSPGAKQRGGIDATRACEGHTDARPRAERPPWPEGGAR